MSGLTFKPDLAELVAVGTKTQTRRLARFDNPQSPWWHERCAFQVGGGPGGSYAVQPGRGRVAICRVRMLSVVRMPLGALSLADARAEGFDTVSDFEAAWARINRFYLSHALVWRLAFERAAS